MLSQFQNAPSFAASVIIPTFNRCDLLLQSLESLRQQDPSTASFEVIIADDGSSDETFQRARAAYNDLNLKYVYYPDHGYHVTRARNMGIRLAEGQVSIFMDAGNVACNTFVRSHLLAHSTNSRSAVMGYCWGNDSFANFEDERFRRQEISAQSLIAGARHDARLADIREKIFGRCNDDVSSLDSAWGLFWGGNISVPTRSAIEVGGFDEWYSSWSGEDVDFGLALKLAGHTFLFSREAQVLALPHPKDRDVRLESSKRNTSYLHRKFNNRESEALLKHKFGDNMVEAELNSAGHENGSM